MRTKDDAPIRIKLMVFYELKEIETMVGDIKESLYQSMMLYVYIIFCWDLCEFCATHLPTNINTQKHVIK